MSRIGRAPIEIPAGVEVTCNGNVVTVKGPKGTLSHNVHPDMTVTVEGNTIHVTRPSDDKLHRSLHGLTRTLIHNMVIGVTEGIYNDMIAYSKHSDLMADEAFRKALGEAFIEIAQTDEGKQIISVFSQVGYTWGKDSDYDGERDAQAMLKSAGK